MVAAEAGWAGPLIKSAGFRLTLEVTLPAGPTAVKVNPRASAQNHVRLASRVGVIVIVSSGFDSPLV